MKSFFSLLLGLMVYASNAYGCDVCGGGIGMFNDAVLPLVRQNFISIGYAGQAFYTQHPPSILNPEKGQPSLDYFHQVSVSARWNPVKRWQITAQLPYQIAYQKQGDSKYQSHGIGDVLVRGQYLLIHQDSLQAKQNLRLGLGVQIPTGYFSPEAADMLSQYALQPGTGAWHLLMNVNYTIRWDKFGAFLRANQRISFQNPEGIRRGAASIIQPMVFAFFAQKSFALVPKAGVKAEIYGKDRIHNQAIEASGGWQAGVVAGVDMYLSKWAITTEVAVPVTHHLSAGKVTPKPQFSIQLIYNL